MLADDLKCHSVLIVQLTCDGVIVVDANRTTLMTLVDVAP